MIPKKGPIKVIKDSKKAGDDSETNLDSIFFSQSAMDATVTDNS